MLIYGEATEPTLFLLLSACCSFTVFKHLTAHLEKYRTRQLYQDLGGCAVLRPLQVLTCSAFRRLCFPVGYDFYAGKIAGCPDGLNNCMKAGVRCKTCQLPP